MANPLIEWMPDGLVYHSLPRPKGLIECDVVLDIGCGVRPMSWYTPKHHVCVEPHQKYLDRVAAVGRYQTVKATALQALINVRPGTVDAIYMLDVIEHMDKQTGQQVIQLALMAQPKQVVVFTPNGFLEQDGPDPWGLDGEYWQKHRSGWVPEDFEGWTTHSFGRGFYAVWTNGIGRLLAA